MVARLACVTLTTWQVGDNHTHSMSVCFMQSWFVELPQNGKK